MENILICDQSFSRQKEYRTLSTSTQPHPTAKLTHTIPHFMNKKVSSECANFKFGPLVAKLPLN